MAGSDFSRTSEIETNQPNLHPEQKPKKTTARNMSAGGFGFLT
jgi:hypothetical protein